MEKSKYRKKNNDLRVNALTIGIFALLLIHLFNKYLSSIFNAAGNMLGYADTAVTKMELGLSGSVA